MKTGFPCWYCQFSSIFYDSSKGWPRVDQTGTESGTDVSMGCGLFWLIIPRDQICTVSLHPKGHFCTHFKMVPYFLLLSICKKLPARKQTVDCNAVILLVLSFIYVPPSSETIRPVTQRTHVKISWPWIYSENQSSCLNLAPVFSYWNLTFGVFVESPAAVQ